MGRKNAKHKPAMAVTWFAGIGPLLSVRHAELVSASMVCPSALRGVCRKVRPWMLKQVQDDEGWISRGMVKRRHRLATTGVASMHEPQSLGQRNALCLVGQDDPLAHPRVAADRHRHAIRRTSWQARVSPYVSHSVVGGPSK